MIPSTEYDLHVRCIDDAKPLYCATCTELPDLEDFGETEAKAMNLLQESIQVAQEMCLEQGTEFPRPNKWQIKTECPRCMYDYSVTEWKYQLGALAPRDLIWDVMRCCPACGVDVVDAGFDKAERLMAESRRLSKSALFDLRKGVLFSLILAAVVVVVKLANELL